MKNLPRLICTAFVPLAMPWFLNAAWNGDWKWVATLGIFMIFAMIAVVAGEVVDEIRDRL
jgi:hypothetical protein